LQPTINIAERIRTLTGDIELDLTTAVVSYTLTGGYERLNVIDGNGTEIRHETVIHPNGECEGMGICRYCGKEVKHG